MCPGRRGHCRLDDRKGVTCREGSGFRSPWLRARGGSARRRRLCRCAASSSKAAAKAKRAGRMKLNMSATDVDFRTRRSPTASISWQIEYATALKLYNYPDKARAPVGSQIQPEAATGFPVVSKDGKTYTITVKTGLKFSERRAGHRGELRVRDQPRAEPDDAVAGRAVHRRHRRRSGRHRRQGQQGLRRHRPSGNKLIIKLTQPDGGMLAKLGMPFFQALPTNLPTDPHGVNAYPSAGPYYIASRERRPPDHRSKRNRYYKGKRPANVDTFDHQRQHEPRPEPAPGQAGSGRLRHGRPPADGALPTSRSSSASTRAGTSSTSSSRPTTSR